MFLREKIAEIERQRKTLVVYSSDPDTDIADQFGTKNVSVQYKRIRSVGENDFIVVRDSNGFRGAIGLASLREFFTPPISVPWSSEYDPSNFRDLLDLFDRLLFASFDKRQMLGTSREIEDRAWRVGHGELHVGFQSFSAFRRQLPVYRRLATQTRLDIHIYGRTDWNPPALRNTTLHAERTTEIGTIWFLVYDGGGDDFQKCALLAEEQEPGEFYGFWTYDPVAVDELLDYLRRTYGQ
ncbi:DICT sensory domain-containing protein [Haladaptatus sp. NG-SE-30]